MKKVVIVVMAAALLFMACKPVMIKGGPVEPIRLKDGVFRGRAKGGPVTVDLFYFSQIVVLLFI